MYSEYVFELLLAVVLAVLGKPRTAAFLDHTPPLGVLAMCHSATCIMNSL